MCAQASHLVCLYRWPAPACTNTKKKLYTLSIECIHGSSASQEIHQILWDFKVHYMFQEPLPPMIPLLCQTNPVDTLPSQSRSTLILSFYLCTGVLSDHFPSSFTTTTLDRLLFSPMHATCFTHVTIFDFHHPTLYATKHKKLTSSLYNFTQPTVSSFLLAPNIFLHMLPLHTLSKDT